MFSNGFDQVNNVLDNVLENNLVVAKQNPSELFFDCYKMFFKHCYYRFAPYFSTRN